MAKRKGNSLECLWGKGKDIKISTQEIMDITNEGWDIDDLTKEDIIEINMKLGKEFHTDFGLGTNRSNFDAALEHKTPHYIAMEILRGHPFIDGNKRTALMVYMLLSSPKTYDEILNDFYDIFKALAK